MQATVADLQEAIHKRSKLSYSASQYSNSIHISDNVWTQIWVVKDCIFTFTFWKFSFLELILVVKVCIFKWLEDSPLVVSLDWIIEKLRFFSSSSKVFIVGYYLLPFLMLHYHWCLLAWLLVCVCWQCIWSFDFHNAVFMTSANIVTCANYTTEIYQWLGFNIATQTVAGYVFLAVATSIMTNWALAKHQRLKKVLFFSFFRSSGGRGKRLYSFSLRLNMNRDLHLLFVIYLS